MSKKQLRLEMLLLIEKHNKEDICFVECKGCETCDKIADIGKVLSGKEQKVIKRAPYGSVKRELTDFFENYGYNLTFKEANEYKYINCSEEYYHRIKKQHKKNKNKGV